jgi:hypothetical protein
MKNIMKSKERLTWIRQNLDRGDLKQIHGILKDVKYETVRAIINGAFFGKHGEEVIKEAINYICIKLKQAELERKQLKELKKRYSNK